MSSYAKTKIHSTWLQVKDLTGHRGKEKETCQKWKKSQKKTPLKPRFHGNEFDMKLLKNILGYFYFSAKSDVQISQCIQENKSNPKNRILLVVSLLHFFNAVFVAWWWKEIPYPPMVNLQIPGSSMFLRKNIQIEATPAISNHLVRDKIKTLKTETSLGQVN